MLFSARSAKYMPFPNRYPETGASGGAILKPCDRIPTKLATPEPCHKSILFPSLVLKELVYVGL
jgi:hypothetical protein